MVQPSDSLAPQFPVSIKGVVFQGDHAILLRNERNEWELPGGKLDLSESPAECCWIYDILGKVNVFIVTYGCTLISGGKICISSEHKEVGFFRTSELDRLPMPEGYRASVRHWWTLRAEGS